MATTRTPYTSMRADILRMLGRGDAHIGQMTEALPWTLAQLRNALPADPRPINMAAKRDRYHAPAGAQSSLVRTGDMTTPPARPGAMDYAALPSRRASVPVPQQAAPPEEPIQLVRAQQQAPAPQADDGVRLKLGEINARISPLSITADGLSQLGFPHVATEKSAKLYRACDFAAICAAMVEHLRRVREGVAA